MTVHFGRYKQILTLPARTFFFPEAEKQWEKDKLKQKVIGLP
jgi:hypothetical protein